MNLLKKNLPVIFAFLLGGLIVYLVMSLQQARSDLNELSENISKPVEKVEKVEQSKDEPQAKHWMDELIDKKTAETEQRTKDQQAEGDNFKQQFDQFAE